MSTIKSLLVSTLCILSSTLCAVTEKQQEVIETMHTLLENTEYANGKNPELENDSIREAYWNFNINRHYTLPNYIAPDLRNLSKEEYANQAAEMVRSIIELELGKPFKDLSGFSPAGLRWPGILALRQTALQGNVWVVAL